MFLKQLARQEKLTNVSDDNANFALLIVDLDGFKKINDQLGHLNGDNILRMVAARLELLVTDNIKAYRLGGDEFAFIVNSTTELENLKKVTQQLSQQVLQQSNVPYKLEHRSYAITSSVGISNYPADTDNLETLCTNVIHNKTFKTKQYSLLAKELQKHLNYLFTHCKLPKGADEQLHTLLFSIMKGNEQMTDSGNKRKGAIKVIKALQAYPVYFNDDNWLAISH